MTTITKYYIVVKTPARPTPARYGSPVTTRENAILRAQYMQDQHASPDEIWGVEVVNVTETTEELVWMQ